MTKDFPKQKAKECRDCTQYSIRFYGCDICKIKKQQDLKKATAKKE